MALIISIKPVIMRAQQRSDGSYNVKIRVTFKRRYRILSTNLTAYPRDLARSGEIKGTVLLDANKIIEKMYSAVAELNWFDLDMMDVDDVVRHIRQNLRARSSFYLDFFRYADGYISARKPSTGNAYRTAVNSFRNFIGRNEFDFSEFSVPLVRRYVDHLNTTPKLCSSGIAKKKGVSAKSYTSMLSAIYSQAMDDYNDEDAKVIRIKGNPFKKVKVEALPSRAKIAQSPELIQKVINAVGSASTPENQRRALEVYLISFALMGVNTADLVEMAPAKDGVVIYHRKKTKDRSYDASEMHCRLEPCIYPLLKKYADPTGQKLLDLGNFSWPTQLNNQLNNVLKRWAEVNGVERFTVNSARHAWATIARTDRVGIPPSLVDESLVHSRNKLLDVYAERDWTVYWKANEKVLGIFDWSPIK